MHYATQGCDKGGAGVVKRPVKHHKAFLIEADINKKKGVYSMPVNSKLYDYDAGNKLCKINTDLNAYKNGKFYSQGLLRKTTTFN